MLEELKAKVLQANLALVKHNLITFMYRKRLHTVIQYSIDKSQKKLYNILGNKETNLSGDNYEHKNRKR